MFTRCSLSLSLEATFSCRCRISSYESYLPVPIFSVLTFPTAPPPLLDWIEELPLNCVSREEEDGSAIKECGADEVEAAR